MEISCGTGIWEEQDTTIYGLNNDTRRRLLLAGTSLFSNQSGDKKANNIGGSDVWVIRLMKNGEELWQQTLGATVNDEASAVVQSVDQGFFIAGNISSHKQLFGSKDVFISLN